jgi:hypothetical protein
MEHAPKRLDSIPSARMQQDGPETPYEVYCARCRVTFPVGTKYCVHCGGRIGRERFRPTLELPPGTDEIHVEDDLQKRSGLSPFTLVWLLLLLGGYLYRSCAS